MKLTPGTSINPGDTVSRQTLFDLVSLAAHDQIQQTDIDQSDGMTVTWVSGSPPLIHRPGQLWWDTTDQVMKVFTDAIENTGCSLYLAFGPDRFDCALLAVEPIPFGAAVQLTNDGRHAKLPPTPHELTALGSNIRWEVAKVVGFSQGDNQANRNTTASGAWFACAMEGYCWCWYPVNRNIAGTWAGSLGGNSPSNSDTLIRSATDITSPTGISMVRGGIAHYGNAQISGNDREPLLVQSLWRVDVNNTNYARRIFFGPRIGRPG